MKETAVALSAEERDYLSRQLRRGDVEPAFADRCAIVLRCAEGLDDGQVAASLGVQNRTVEQCRRRFLRHRIHGLLRWSPRDLAMVLLILLIVIAVWVVSVYTTGLQSVGLPDE